MQSLQKWYVPKLASVAKAARILDVSKDTVSHAISSNQLEYITTKSGRYLVKIMVGMSKEEALEILDN